MSATLAVPAPPALTPRPFTLAEYHRLIAAGVIPDDERCEFLNGVIVKIMPIHPPHSLATKRLFQALLILLTPRGYHVNSQNPVTLPADEPQPDGFVAVGPDARYGGRHPSASELLIVAEVADSTVWTDTRVKLPLYGAAGIPEYWIVNLVDRRVEVYTQPTPTGYAQRVDYLPGDAVPVVLNGQTLGAVAVVDVIP